MSHQWMKNVSTLEHYIQSMIFKPRILTDKYENDKILEAAHGKGLILNLIRWEPQL